MTTHSTSSSTPTLPRQSPLLLIARDIKLSHSIFAMPFALLAGFLAAAQRGKLLPWDLLGLIVASMVLGRTVAMTVNRWADRFLDELNPRTAGRAIPSGRLDARYMLATAILGALGFVAVTAGFWWVDGNPWPLILSPVVLAWLAGYSFTKRFTWLCHLFLGSALAISPLAAAIAIEPAFLAEPTVWLLAAMVLCWVAGFDVIYALQDVSIDREQRIYSMPAHLGVERALWVSRALHAVCLASLAAACAVSPVLGLAFAIGVAAVGALLALEHALVWNSRTHHLNTAFFTVNGLISVLLGSLGVLDVVRQLVS